MPVNQDSNQPAWTDRDLVDPHTKSDKAVRVQQMFSAIATSYDRNNRLHSLWRDQAWRRMAVTLCNVRAADVVLDVACGTGDLAMAFSGTEASRVVGVDFTHAMLEVAQHKSHAQPGCPLTYLDGDAMRLPVADQSVDIVSIAFGIRNVTDPAAAIAEFRRVLRPGGRLCILEFSLPRNAIMRSLYNFYFRHIMPHTATLISGDRSGAYKYLPKSVNTFIEREQLMNMMNQAGFMNVHARPMTFGVAVCYLGKVV